MNALYTYIFKHNRYKEVIALSDEAVTKYGNAIKFGLNIRNLFQGTPFKTKK